MTSEDKLWEAIDQYIPKNEEEVNTESTNSFPVVNPFPSNRRERKKDAIRWKKHLKEHIKRKPEYNVTDPNNLTDTDFVGLEKIREWTATFINIKQKLNALGVK